MKKKLLLIGLIIISIFCFTSCAELDIPEGDIKDFISSFDGDNAYLNIHYGKCYIENIKYEGDEEVEIGKHTSLSYFDKRNKEFYHYLETNANGSFYGETATYNFKHQITVCHVKEDEPADLYAKQITDGVVKQLEYKYEDVINSVKSFFYSEVNAGYHTGGVYYGDYILNNVSKYYKHFSLNDEKTELTFEINISTPTEEGNEILNCHKFVVNKYGLVVSVKTTAYYIIDDKIDSTLVTEMSCDYVTEFEKKLDL